MSSTQYRVTFFPARANRECLKSSLLFSADQNGTSQLHFHHTSSWRAARVPTSIVQACMCWPGPASPQAVFQQVASLRLANTSLVFPVIKFKKISTRSTPVQWQIWKRTESKQRCISHKLEYPGSQNCFSVSQNSWQTSRRVWDKLEPQETSRSHLL